MNIDENLQALIHEKTFEALVKELKKKNMLKSGKQTPFQKTETLLYNYPKFQNVLKNKLEEIEMIEKEGISMRSKSFVQWRSNNSYDNSNDYERSLNAIDKIKASIVQIEGYIFKIDAALNPIKDDPYFEIIPMKYFESKSREYIAEELYCDIRTVDRNKNRLVNLLQIRLFSEEYLEQLLFG
ncbi:sigma-70 family RNA polymerase sigma factor [Alkaliphilus sp. B6464]|uniref:sigma-70 family RNA polymerase sigma factor n=1 Tax=Alkaliphilus sp. B6464 TaxID=2731219 RepID=UPI001BA51545|nr:sigma-70 family RNA polymerase sigma factor [Alkaliphilus sp. B6464]QUH18689.1 sigma-70 family RNA polymerase sigma factor [Alkaliphilus sp. B6464]